ncbi:MAG TPA: phage holin family protein [Oscillospiraceae bacterium]|nr:phage holin family protein [Oscillospiraceae bacterium]
MDFGFAPVGAITVICYLLAQGVKATLIDNKWIPVIAGTMGGILGVAALFVMPSFPATDAITAAAVGIVSGFAATGVHECVRQLSGSSGKTAGDAAGENTNAGK